MGGVHGLFGSRRGRMVVTGQTTVYHVGDDAGYRRGLTRGLTLLNAGQYAGTTAIDVAHYAAPTISFTAPNTIADAAAGLITVLTGDTVRVRGSALNDGIYTVAVGGVAGQFTVNEAVVNEGAGPYVTLYKRAAYNNNCVYDRRSGLLWLANSTNALRIGNTVNGTLAWYDAALLAALHPAAADLQMIAATRTLRIVGGAAEVNRYHAGDPIVCTGFANAVNNLPGYVVQSVTVNGADLDIVLLTIGQTLLDEAAAGARSISLITRTVFALAAAANQSAIAGYSDWRVPNSFELVTLPLCEAPVGQPDPAFFTGYASMSIWGASTDASNVARGMAAGYLQPNIGQSVKTAVYRTTLVRG